MFKKKKKNLYVLYLQTTEHKTIYSFLERTTSNNLTCTYDARDSIKREYAC